MIKKSNTLLAAITFMAAMVTVQPNILAQTKGKATPVQQAPPADRGQNNFGGTHSNDTTGRAARLRAMREREARNNQIRTVHFNELSMSDPFIYPDPYTSTRIKTFTFNRRQKSLTPYTCET